RTETRKRHIHERGLTATGYHDISITPLNDLESITDRVRTRRTGGRCTRAYPFSAEHHRHASCRHIGDHHRYEKWTDPAVSFFIKNTDLIFKRSHSTDAGSDPDTDLFRIFFRYL